MCENVDAPSLALMQPRPWRATNGSFGEHEDPTAQTEGETDMRGTSACLALLALIAAQPVAAATLGSDITRWTTDEETETLTIENFGTEPVRLVPVRAEN